VRCWGANASGQLGDGSTTTRTSPRLVSGVTDAATVEAGHAETCVVLSGGNLRCWGSNASGELGNGTTTASSSPVLVLAP
jgi:alpha-tubulin suppressor-like RCC1 family protein